MTGTPENAIDRLANIVERFINASTARHDQVEIEQAQFRERQIQLERAQLRFQEQLGDLARLIARHDQLIARQDQQLEEIRQRQAESDQRFDILLQEIRFLIHQQRRDTDDQPEE